MSIAQDREAAVDELDELLVAKGSAQKTLNSQANKLRQQAVDETNPAKRSRLERQANDIARKAIDLNRENFRLLHVRNRILRSISLSGVLKKLRNLTRDARREVKRMQKIAESIGAVTDLISTIQRFSTLVV